MKREVEHLQDLVVDLQHRAWECEDKVRDLEARLTYEMDRRLDAEARVEEMDVSAHLMSRP